MTIDEIRNELSDEEFGEWLAYEIKKKLKEKDWPIYEYLLKISQKRVYEVEKKRYARTKI